VVALARWGYAHEEHISSSRHELNLPWDKLEHRSFFTDDDSPRQRLHTLVWCNDAAVADVAADQEAYTQISAAAEALNDRVRDLVESIKTEYLARAWAVERARFDEDFGDADLWEAHKKTKERDIRFPHELRPYSGRGSRRHDLLWDAVALFVERGEDVVGRVVADVLKEATTRFGSEQAQAHKSWDSDPAKYVYTAPQELLEYVLAEPIVDEDTESDGADDIEDDE
jgi:hypothetical protein